MANRRKNLDTVPGQTSLFDLIRQVSEQQKAVSFEADTPGRLNLDAAIREMVSEALKRTEKSRYQVAAEMSRLLGREITKAMLDSWSAESKENHRFPVAYLTAFEVATGDKAILRLLCEMAGGFFIAGEDALYTELGKIDQMKRDLAAKEKLIKQTLEQLKT